MRNNLPNREALAQSQSYDNVCVSETWWEESCDWRAVMDGSRLFRRGRQGREVVLWVKVGLACVTVLAVGGDTVESLWVGIGGKANKADIVVGVRYRSPSQDDGTDALVNKELTPPLKQLPLSLGATSTSQMLTGTLIQQTQRGPGNS